MLLKPKKTKYKKVFKKPQTKYTTKKPILKYGTIGLKAVNSGMVSSRQIEASRQAISRKIKKKGKLWIRIFPHLPITKKPIESRMGKGKGNVVKWVSKVKAGNILFEIYGASVKLSLIAFKTGQAKLPIKTKVIYNY